MNWAAWIMVAIYVFAFFGSLAGQGKWIRVTGWSVIHTALMFFLLLCALDVITISP